MMATGIPGRGEGTGARAMGVRSWRTGQLDDERTWTGQWKEWEPVTKVCGARRESSRRRPGEGFNLSVSEVTKGLITRRSCPSS